MSISTHFKGAITELQVAEHLLQRGWSVSKPLVPDSRYDYIVDYNNRLLKIQVKTAQLGTDGTYLVLPTSTSHTNTKGTVNIKYTATDIDYFATVYENNCYIIPVSLCRNRYVHLRLQPTKNKQVKNVHFLEDFLIDKVLPQERKGD